MLYKNIIEGRFLERPNRFIARVMIDGKEEIAHVKNTGRCKELLVKNAKIYLEDNSHNPNRKTKYSLISVWKEDMLVNMDSQVPNQVVFDGLKNNEIEGYKDLTLVKKEVTFQKSRYDIYYEKNHIKGFVEVKGVTLENDGIAAFPDAPTERGTKHVLEMIEAKKKGYEGTILFLIQMRRPYIFKPNFLMDPKFSEAISLAKSKGINILAYDSLVGKDSIHIGKRIEIEV